MTLRLDADLARFFRRAWGRGDPQEMNLVLRAFFKLHMSKMVKGEAGFETLLAEARAEPRPEIRAGGAGPSGQGALRRAGGGWGVRGLPHGPGWGRGG